MIKLDSFKKRRDFFYELLEDRAAIIPAATAALHHADCDYPFRQHSDFWYLTGFDEPDAVALFLPHRPLGERFVLFALPKAPDQEIWTGARAGLKDAVEIFGADIAHSLDEFPDRLSHYLEGAKDVVFRIGKHPKVEPIVLRAVSSQLDQIQRTGLNPFALISPCPLIHKLRLRKDFEEIERLKQAALISAEAHEVAREFTRPGMNERQIQAVIEKHFLENEARGPAYSSIVAGGMNACILHYTQNNSLLNDGDLVLIDAGCSLNDYYNGDITRTFPVNGSFTSEQKAIYEIVLAAQEAAIASVIVGQNTESIHLIAVKVLVEGLLEIGLLKGSVDSVIENGLYRHLYMHKTGHWLGLDVHDVGAYRLGEYPVALEEGMVLTVEPGIYISDLLPIPEGQPDIPEAWKGIGIRIEDDVVVKKNGPEVISSKAKKSIIDLER